MEANQSPVQMVVGYDFSDTARVTLSRAIQLADSEPRHMLHIITVLDEHGGVGVQSTGKTDYTTADEVHEMLIKEIEARLKADNPTREIRFFVHVRLGAPATEILALAQEVGAHIVLVGSHGRTGLRRVLMGSVSEKVVREAKCPVLVVREREYQDVELATVVEAPPDHADERPYIKPHRYSYSNQLMQPQKPSWPWY